MPGEPSLAAPKFKFTKFVAPAGALEAALDSGSSSLSSAAAGRGVRRSKEPKVAPSYTCIPGGGRPRGLEVVVEGVEGGAKAAGRGVGHVPGHADAVAEVRKGALEVGLVLLVEGLEFLDIDGVDVAVVEEDLGDVAKGVGDDVEGVAGRGFRRRVAEARAVRAAQSPAAGSSGAAGREGGDVVEVGDEMVRCLDGRVRLGWKTLGDFFFTFLEAPDLESCSHSVSTHILGRELISR